MALRGENVGTAYVRILADGDGLDDSIRDLFDDDEDLFDREGKRAAEAWAEGYKDQMEARPTRRKMQEGLRRSLGKIDYKREFLSSGNWERFRGELRTMFGEAGERAGHNLEQGMYRGMDIRAILGRIDDIQSEVAKAQEQLWREQNQKWRATLNEAYQLNRQHDQARLESFRDSIDNAEAEYRVHINALIREDERRRAEQERIHRLGRMQEQALLEDRQRTLLALRDSYALVSRESRQLIAGDRGASMSKKELRAEIARITESMRDLGYENVVWKDVLNDTDRALVRLHPRLNNFRRGLYRISDGMGAAFGRGSRNDFVNFTGSMVRNLVRLPGLLTSVGEGLASMLTSWRGVATLAGGAAGGIGVAFGFLGPVISLFSMAAGAVTALASTISMGLIGAVGALAGAFVPVVAGIGTMVLAFQNAGPEARRALRSIKGEFAGLGDIAGETVFTNVTEQARRFRGVISDIEPLVADIGMAISRVGDYWLDMMEGPGFSNFQDTMTDFLPGAVESLGRTFANVLGGVGGTLRALVPITEQFLGWLEGITREFSNWSNSAAGQSRMLSFFRDAADSASELGGFIGAVVDLFGELITQGNEAGDSLFRSMTQTIQGWANTLRENPNILRGWVQDGADFARAIGNALRSVGRLADVLDNAFSRGVATGAINTLSTAIQGLTVPLRAVARLFGTSEDAALGFAGQAAGMAGMMLMLRGRIAGVGGGFKGFVGNLRNAETRMAQVGRVARGAAGVGGLAALSAGAETSNKSMQALTDVGGGAMLGLFAGGGPLTAAIGATAGAFKFVLGEQLKDTGSDFANARPKVASFATTMDGVADATESATRALALQKLQRQDVIGQAKQFGVSARDLVSASLGERDAIKRVNDALRGQPDLLRNLAAGNILRGIGNVRGEFERTGRAIDDQKDQVLSWREALQGIPKKVRTDVKALGMDMTVRELRGLNRQYDLTPKQIRTIVEATNLDLTDRELRGLIKQMNNVDGKKANPEVDLDDKGFQKKHRGVMFDVEDLAKQKPTATADLDPKPANSIINGLLRDLGNYGRQRPVAGADVNGAPAVNSLNGLMQRLGAWGRSSATATANVNVGNSITTLDNLQSRLNGLMDKTVTVTTQYVNTGSGKVPRRASGGIQSGATIAMIGEAGPEAIVPLNRPLNQVDPAVRLLSAFAQGKLEKMASGGVVGTGKTYNVEQNIYTMADPVAAARETVNSLVAVGY